MDEIKKSKKKMEKYLLHNFNYILMIKIILIIVKKK